MTSESVPNYIEEESYEDDSPVMNFIEEEDYESTEREFSASSPVPESATIGADRTPDGASQPSPKTTANHREPAATKYGRSVFTDKDRLGLWFLWKFPLATSKQLGIAWGIKKQSAHKRLLALKELGLVGSERVMGMTQLWFLTKRGQDLLVFHGSKDDRVSRLYKLGSVNLSKLAHQLAVTQVAAQLVGGVSEIPRMGTVPVPTGLELMPLLIPEPYMNSTYATMASRFDKTEKRSVIDADQAWRDQQRVAQEVESGRLRVSDALAQNPGQWTLTTDYTSRTYGMQNHPVDLAIDLEAHRTDLKQPVSIGIEVELTPKNEDDFGRITKTMISQRERGAVPVFGRIIYVSHVPRIFKALEGIREKLGGVAHALLGAITLKDAEGKRYKGEAWRF